MQTLRPKDIAAHTRKLLKKAHPKIKFSVDVTNDKDLFTTNNETILEIIYDDPKLTKEKIRVTTHPLGIGKPNGTVTIDGITYQHNVTRLDIINNHKS